MKISFVRQLDADEHKPYLLIVSYHDPYYHKNDNVIDFVDVSRKITGTATLFNLARLKIDFGRVNAQGNRT